MSEIHSKYPFDLHDKSLSSYIYLHISNTLARGVYTENSDANNLFVFAKKFCFFMRVESISEYVRIFNFISHIMLRKKKTLG